MATNRAIIEKVYDYNTGSDAINVYTTYLDTNDDITQQGDVQVPMTGVNTNGAFTAAIMAAVITASPSSITADQILWMRSDGSRSFSNPSLAVNTARQASTIRDAFVSVSVDITANLTLLTGQRGTVTLQYADDSAFTTNVKTAQASTNGNTGTFTAGLALNQTVSAAVSGIIPAGKYYRILTTNNSGTPTYGTPAVQEVLL